MDSKLFIKPISLIAQDDLEPAEIAKLINLLSEFYGENLEILSIDNMPPTHQRREYA